VPIVNETQARRVVRPPIRRPEIDPMTLRLSLICHGATAATRSAAFSRDEPLEPGAVRRAETVGKALRPPARAWTSPALRACQTAAALGITASAEPALRDCDHGRWAGRRLADLATEDPDGVAAWLSDPAAAPHGGESLEDLRRRAAAWIDRCAP